MTNPGDAAEQIAALVADIRAGRARRGMPDDATGSAVNRIALGRAQLPQPVVNATGIYWDVLRRLERGDKGINLYDDHPSAAPPWPDALVCYVNQHGNTVALQLHAEPWTIGRRWETPNPVDWFRVKWLIETMVWVGGRAGNGGPLPSTGPVYAFQHAVYPDGSPADIHWVDLLRQGRQDEWDVPMVTLSAVLNFLNCSNVETTEPQRLRPERRRVARTGVTVEEIVVRAIGKRAASTGPARRANADDLPFSPVRGHFAHYGPRYGREKLFGKYEGKFWVPGHARGKKPDDGTAPAPRDYLLRPAAPEKTSS